jgi:hypothetical protein
MARQSPLSRSPYLSSLSASGLLPYGLLDALQRGGRAQPALGHPSSLIASAQAFQAAQAELVVQDARELGFPKRRERHHIGSGARTQREIVGPQMQYLDASNVVGNDLAVDWRGSPDGGVGDPVVIAEIDLCVHCIRIQHIPPL